MGFKTIAMFDDGIAFDGETMRQSPLGGTQKAFVNLAEAFADKGYLVTCYTNGPGVGSVNGVNWRAFNQAVSPAKADLVIVNRNAALLRFGKGVQNLVLWLHNAARYLRKPRHLWPLLRYRPVLHFLGPSHLKTCPAYIPCRDKMVSPHGIDDLFRHAPEKIQAPPPLAVFTSHPARGLSWLIDRWTEGIQPKLPDARLRIYAGTQTYQLSRGKNYHSIQSALQKAHDAALSGVEVFDPVRGKELVDKLLACRVMLYQGDIGQGNVGETFCLAVAEAQALGIPAVVQPIGSLPERVIDGVTGFIAQTDQAFIEKALLLLQDDDTWLTFHRNCLAYQRQRTYADMVEDYEKTFQ